jgi:bacterioferritin-associated ferredoxin
MAVTMCLCYGRTFEEVKEEAEEHGWTTVAEIGKNLGCGTGCGLCRPYLAKMLETGETHFEAIREPEKQATAGEPAKSRWGWKLGGK